jgi:hypothetical protein
MGDSDPPPSSEFADNLRAALETFGRLSADEQAAMADRIQVTRDLLVGETIAGLAGRRDKDLRGTKGRFNANKVILKIDIPQAEQVNQKVEAAFDAARQQINDMLARAALNSQIAAMRRELNEAAAQAASQMNAALALITEPPTEESAPSTAPPAESSQPGQAETAPPSTSEPVSPPPSGSTDGSPGGDSSQSG